MTAHNKEQNIMWALCSENVPSDENCFLHFCVKLRSTSDVEHLNCDKLQIDRILCSYFFQRVAQMKCMVSRPDGP